MNSKREIELVVISDTHLGSYGSRAEELFNYLNSINPKKIVLNGDIIDVWQFKKRNWDKYHTKTIKKLVEFISQGVQVYYIAGNHDESFRRFLNFEIHGFKILNKISLELDGKKAWFFHGDVFDVAMQYSRWLTRLGSIGYEFLIFLNFIINSLLSFFGKEKLSFSKKIKNGVKAAVSYITKFESVVSEIGIQNKFDYVICGHIHQPIIKTVTIGKSSIQYLNSGDWIENLTALEYNNKQWSLYSYNSKDFKDLNENQSFKKPNELFSELIYEINLYHL